MFAREGNCGVMLAHIQHLVVHGGTGRVIDHGRQTGVRCGGARYSVSQIPGAARDGRLHSLQKAVLLKELELLRSQVDFGGGVA